MLPIFGARRQRRVSIQINDIDLLRGGSYFGQQFILCMPDCFGSKAKPKRYTYQLLQLVLRERGNCAQKFSLAQALGVLHDSEEGVQI